MRLIGCPENTVLLNSTKQKAISNKRQMASFLRSGNPFQNSIKCRTETDLHLLTELTDMFVLKRPENKLGE